MTMNGQFGLGVASNIMMYLRNALHYTEGPQAYQDHPLTGTICMSSY